MADVIFGPTKQGDRFDSLLLELKNKDGSSPNLTGLLTSDIRIHIKDLTNPDTPVQESNISFIVSATSPAIVRYDPTSQDVASPRELELEIKVTFAGGKPKRYPACDRFLWPIVKNIA